MAKESKKEGSGGRRRNAAANLTDELIIEILSRLPAKSICRCKCISRWWRDVISDPDHRKKLPQTLVGFFYRSDKEGRFPKQARHFVNATERDRPLICPSFSFLPRSESIRMVDSCGGLLLCRCFMSSDDFCYVVCNPSTEEWVAFLDSGYNPEREVFNFCTYLGFDPAVSSHFHVFEFVMDDCGFVDGVEIYSLETGLWNYMESEWALIPPCMITQGPLIFNGICCI